MVGNYLGRWPRNFPHRTLRIASKLGHVVDVGLDITRGCLNEQPSMLGAQGKTGSVSCTRTSRVLRLKGTAILLALTFWTCAISPQLYASLAIPPRVRFIGMLLPIKEQSRKGLLEDLNVIIGKERWTFLLDKMEIVGGVGLNRLILQRLFPPLVRFVGPDDLIRRLKSPKIAGKTLTIEGLLYTGSGILFVTGVDEGEEAGRN